MYRRLLLVLPILSFFNALGLQAQSVTWSRDVAPIIYSHCTTCHRSGEIGPFPLESYEDATAWADMIAYTTQIRFMPPWKPDPTYGGAFIGTNRLTDQQIATIKAWVDAGAPEGDPTEAPPPPTFPTGSQVGTPDVSLSFASAHRVSASNTDEYRFFVLPTGLREDRDLVALELRPGNTSLVHHALFWTDTTGTAARLDAETPEYGYVGRGAEAGQARFGDQLPGYVPGSRPIVYTQGMAQKIPANSDIVIQMHYAPTTVGGTDSSTVNLFFSKTPARRYVRSHIMLPPAIVNGPFVMPPNSVTTFEGRYTVPITVTLLGLAPHAHLLNRAWKVYAVTPEQDTIPLISIPDWDFNWQGSYHFARPVVLPRGSTLVAFATYDNTEANPFNPSIPPTTVRWGEGTTDEMFYLPFLWLPYQSGDEDLVLEDVPTSVESALTPEHDVRLYPLAPNPVRGPVTIGYTLDRTTAMTLEVYDMQGLRQSIIRHDRKALPGQHLVDWDTSTLPAGMYRVVLRTNATMVSQALLVP